LYTTEEKAVITGVVILIAFQILYWFYNGPYAEIIIKQYSNASMIYITDEGNTRNVSDAQQNILTVLISLGKYSCGSLPQCLQTPFVPETS
jgi:hypothetical protein